jgi:hypothetical protein
MIRNRSASRKNPVIASVLCEVPLLDSAYKRDSKSGTICRWIDCFVVSLSEPLLAMTLGATLRDPDAPFWIPDNIDEILHTFKCQIALSC